MIYIYIYIERERESARQSMAAGKLDVKNGVRGRVGKDV